MGLDGSVHESADGLFVPNGSVIHDRVPIVNEWGNRAMAFDIQADGSLANRRARYGEPTMQTDADAAIGDMTIAADGCPLDSEGDCESRTLRMAAVSGCCLEAGLWKNSVLAPVYASAHSVGRADRRCSSAPR